MTLALSGHNFSLIPSFTCGLEGGQVGQWIRTEIPVLTLSFPGHVVLDKSFHLSEPQCPQFKTKE